MTASEQSRVTYAGAHLGAVFGQLPTTTSVCGMLVLGLFS